MDVASRLAPLYLLLYSKNEEHACESDFRCHCRCVLCRLNMILVMYKDERPPEISPPINSTSCASVFSSRRGTNGKPREKHVFPAPEDQKHQACT